MRANDIVLPTKGTLSLNYPQDGITQPASFQRVAATRKARTSVTILVKPNQNDPLASVNSLKLVDPTTVTDPVTSVITVGTPLRLDIDVRVPSNATDEQLAAFRQTVIELLADEQVLSALFESNRLI